MVGYPAAFSSVLGVDMKHYTDPMMFRYVNNHKVEVNAKGIYVEAPAAGGGTQWYTGTSFACPHVSGMAARLRQTMPGLSMPQLRLALLCLSNDTAEDEAL